MSKAKISEEILKKNDIPILDFNKLEFNIQNEITKSGIGKFYLGKYDNKNISLKEVDITIDESIINEFILWKFFQKNSCFLKMKGIILNYNQAYIIFEDNFNETIQSLLEQNKLTYEEKIIITKEILNILNILNEEKKLNANINPETLVFNSEKKVKLIDLGVLVNLEKFLSEEEIKKRKIKYAPPEYIIQNEVNQSYDIYSFGCILIDLFSKDLNNCIFANKNKSYEEYLSDIIDNKYPKIPNNINYLLQGIISRCLINDPKKRIKINELTYNLNILLDYLKDAKTKISFKKEINDNDFKNEVIENENTKKLKEIYNFSKNLNKETSEILNHINSELQINISNMKNNLLNEYDNCLKEIDKNYKLIKDKLDDIINTNKKLIESFYHKIMNNIY